VNDDLSPAKSASKPIVKLVDITKIYEMGRAGGGGLLSRRTPVTKKYKQRRKR